MVEEEIISIDGKTVRHSFDGRNDRSAIHMVSAWANKAGDYVLALKGNQERLNGDLELYFEGIDGNNYGKKIFDYNQDIDKGHGRIEVQECWCTEDIQWLEQRGEWRNLKSIALIRSTRIIGDEKTVEDRLYISSLDADAEKHNSVIRWHWRIENSLHWILDMAFDEDIRTYNQKYARAFLEPLRPYHHISEVSS